MMPSSKMWSPITRTNSLSTRLAADRAEVPLPSGQAWFSTEVMRSPRRNATWPTKASTRAAWYPVTTTKVVDARLGDGGNDPSDEGQPLDHLQRLAPRATQPAAATGSQNDTAHPHVSPPECVGPSASGPDGR